MRQPLPTVLAHTRLSPCQVIYVGHPTSGRLEESLAAR